MSVADSVDSCVVICFCCIVSVPGRLLNVLCGVCERLAFVYAPLVGLYEEYYLSSLFYSVSLLP